MLFLTLFVFIHSVGMFSSTNENHLFGSPLAFQNALKQLLVYWSAGMDLKIELMNIA